MVRIIYHHLILEKVLTQPIKVTGGTKRREMVINENIYLREGEQD